MFKKFWWAFHLLILAIFISSCKKYVEVGTPSTQLTSATVFANDVTATAAQLGIYSQMEADGYGYQVSVYSGLSADELTNQSGFPNNIDLFNNNLTSENGIIQSLWAFQYRLIYQANAILAGLKESKGISESIKKYLEGEAKFVRAFCHFYLVNLFGRVPIVVETDYRVNAALPQRELQEVYDQIIEDLQSAIDLLPADFLSNNNTVTSERVRPTKWAARALLSRVKLYTGNWQEAIDLASEVIAQSSQFSLVTDLNKVFLKNSKEAIWQLMVGNPRRNTYEGAQLILTTTANLVSLSPSLLNSFQTGDNRKSSWTKSVTIAGNTYYFPYKYKVGQNSTTVTEYTSVLRLAELYLIRAEAKARLNDLAGAIADINIIRNRAGLSNTSAITQQQILNAIRIERNSELFVEFGDRWLDLKRTGTATTYLQPVKGLNWSTGVDELYPIPLSEILRNPLLVQNPGY